MAFPVISALSALFNFAAEPLKRWQETKRVQHQANIDRIVAGDNNAAMLDEASIASRGWKDDYLLLLTTAPVFLMFFSPIIELIFLDIPYEKGLIVHTIKESFDTLNVLPEYYWYALALIYIDTFGFRRMLRVAVDKWLSSKFGGSNTVAEQPKKGLFRNDEIQG